MFLGLRKSTFLGIDFGTSSIKAVELTLDNGQPKLLNYAEIDLTGQDKKVLEGKSYDEQIVLHLRALIQKMKPKTKEACVAMPAFIGLTALIEFPEMDEKELEEAIHFEAHKYIPSSLDDVALSWEVVGMKPGASENSSSRMEVLLVAALKNEVARYQSYVEEAGLEMSYLELETFSLVRSVVDHKDGIYLVIDIGSRATNLVLAGNGSVKMSRNLDMGGKEVTRTLAEGLNITMERAESLKKSSKDFFNLPASALVFTTLQGIASEGERMIAAYKEKNPGWACKGIILSGGTGKMTGLKEYYSKIFNLPVEHGNPWQLITVGTDVSLINLDTSFSIAIGLALAKINAADKKDVFKKKFSMKDILNKKL